MADKIMTPNTAPAGSRCIVRGGNGMLEKPYELTVVEWSPKARLKARYENGRQQWLEGLDIPMLVELIGPAEVSHG